MDTSKWKVIDCSTKMVDGHYVTTLHIVTDIHAHVQLVTLEHKNIIPTDLEITLAYTIYINELKKIEQIRKRKIEMIDRFNSLLQPKLW